MSDQQRNRLRVLTRDECLALLRGHLYIGRIGYVVDGVPVIVPVNFVLDGETVVFSTIKGSKLSWLGNHSRVAFQADHGRALDQSGWSVLVRGTAHEITDPAAVRALRRGPRSWAVPSMEHWIGVTIDQISGRRLGRRVRAPSAGPTPGD